MDYPDSLPAITDLKVSRSWDRSTKTVFTCLKSTMKTSEQCAKYVQSMCKVCSNKYKQTCRSGVLFLNFEQVNEGNRKEHAILRNMHS